MVGKRMDCTLTSQNWPIQKQEDVPIMILLGSGYLLLTMSHGTMKVCQGQTAVTMNKCTGQNHSPTASDWTNRISTTYIKSQSHPTCSKDRPQVIMFCMHIIPFIIKAPLSI